MKNKPISPMGDSWSRFEKSIYTTEELAASDLRVALASEIIKARQEKGMTQKQLETMSGVRQPVIARLERGTTDPRLSTMLKILSALGMTLKVVPMEHPH